MPEASELLYATPESGPYSDPYRALPVKLHRAREAFTSRVRGTFQAHDLTDPQWRVLRILSAVDEIDSSDLATRSMLLGPSLSRILRDLDDRGLIARRACAKDARRSLTSITAAGRALIDRVAPDLSPVFEQLRKRMDPRRIAELNRLLDDVIEALSD